MAQAMTHQRGQRGRIPPVVRKLAVACGADSINCPDPKTTIHGEEWRLTNPDAMVRSKLPPGVTIEAVHNYGGDLDVWVGVEK